MNNKSMLSSWDGTCGQEDLQAENDKNKENNNTLTKKFI